MAHEVRSVLCRPLGRISTLLFLLLGYFCMNSTLNAATDAPQVVIMMGPPGSGKGTQAIRIAADLKLPHISTGDILRMHLKNRTDIGQMIRNYLDTGKLVPDQVVIDMLKTRIAEPDCANGFILDGFPRTVAQAEELNKMLGNKYKVTVLDLTLSDKSVVDRITGRRTCSQCGKMYHIVFSPPKKQGVCDACGGELSQRSDDNEQIVQERLNAYHAQIQPLIEFYQSKGIYTQIDGEKTPDEVFKACMQILSQTPAVKS